MLDYRPVSLTSQVCKILERILYRGISDHLSRYNLINGTQHGFLKGKSCLTNLLCFLEVLTKHLDSGIAVDVVYLDFAKAFDKVPHQRLSRKIRAHGICGYIAAWIDAWLRDRSQRVVLNGEASTWKPVLSGVPQGSVLGPLLFLIYLNDIDMGINNTIFKFADDTKLMAPIDSLNDMASLQSDLNKLFDWSTEWQMLFNIDKCKLIHFGRNNDSHCYKINNKELSSVDYEKDLGVIIHRGLKPEIHIADKVKKANMTLGMINRAFEYKSKDMMLQLYKTLVRPHLDYAAPAWSPHLKKDILLIEKVQRRFTRMIPGLRDLCYEARLKKLRLTTLETRRNRADVLEVFKMAKGLTNVDINSLFVLNNSDTRGHRYKLFKQYSRLDVRKFFFTQRVVDIWNSLPAAALDSKSINTFKGFLDRHLQNCQRTVTNP